MFGRSKCALTAVPIIAVGVALLAVQVVHAEYWIAIGAYRAAKTADNLAAEATQKADMTFSARAVQTADGGIYRVVAGPFGSRSEAQARAALAREAGFPDGWIITPDGAPAAMPARSEASADADALRGAPLDDADALLNAPLDIDVDIDSISIEDLSLEDWSLDDDLPPIEVLLEGLPDILPVEITPVTPAPSEPAHEVVAPENYQLNRLRRDARVDLPTDTRQAGTFRARVKWYTSARALPAGDTLREQTGESLPVDHNADLRLMWRPRIGAVKLHLDHSTIALRSDAAGQSPGLTFDQTPTGDDRRLMDLTWGDDAADEHGMQRLHRMDRLAAEYRTGRWGITVGRQALSWGGGMVFQPMDLFNPFSPTTVDQDYKAGDDMVLIERLFANGSDLQVLGVARRAPGANASRGDVERDSSSIAAKYATVLGNNELEVIAAEHYGERVLGVGVRIPIGGALFRSDVVWTSAHDRSYVSGVVNADYTFGVAGSPLHVFVEFFHNGFGVGELPDDLSRLPDPLLERLAIRRELFNLMRNYLAAGTNIQWHFLVNQSVAVIANLHDSSYVAQTALSYDASQASRLHVGLAVPIGGGGDEFGTLAVGDDLTIGGGEQGFVRYVRYF